MSDILSAIGILLVFATVALDFFVKDSQSFARKTRPDNSKTKEIDAFKKEKCRNLFKLAGVLIFYLILFYLLLPNSVKIIETSEFDLWYFNTLSTFYLLINFCLLIFIGLTFKYLIEVINK